MSSGEKKLRIKNVESSEILIEGSWDENLLSDVDKKRGLQTGINRNCIRRNCCNWPFKITVLFPWQKRRSGLRGSDWQPQTPSMSQIIIQQEVFIPAFILHSKHKLMGDYSLAVSSKHLIRRSTSEDLCTHFFCGGCKFRPNGAAVDRWTTGLHF